MLRLLHEVRDAAALECAAYNWSDLRGMTKVDSDQACALAHDLFLCSAAAVLDEAGDARFADALPEISPAVLISAEVKTFAEELKHLRSTASPGAGSSATRWTTFRSTTSRAPRTSAFAVGPCGTAASLPRRPTSSGAR